LPITIVSAATALCFVLTGPLVTTMLAWVDELDNEVDREQRATGSYHGRFRVHDPARRHFKGPHYGVCGGSRCFKTILHPNGLNCAVEVWHPATEYPLLLEDAIEIAAEATTKVPQFPLKILNIEFQTLTAWVHWTSSESFSGRYVYQFGQTTLGCAVEVHDLRTQTMIDVTDYALW